MAREHYRKTKYRRVLKENTMSYDNCLGCGVLLTSTNVYKCTVCGYDNSFGQYYDIPIDDEFLNDFNDNFNPEEEAGY